MLRPLTLRRLLPGATPVTVDDLIASGYFDDVYDPSDLSTLFQSADTSTPVTAMEQPVGYMLDKSGDGHHMVQVTAAKRPVVSRRVNLLTKTDDSTNAVWVASSGTSVSSRKIIAGTTNGYQGINQSVAVTAGVDYFISCKASSAEYSNVVISDGAFSAFAVNFNLTTLSVSSTSGSGYVSSGIVDVGGGERLLWVRCKFTQSVAYARFSGSPTGGVLPAGAYFTGNGTAGVNAWDFDLRLAIDSHLPYQRVNTATDYDSDPAKFPTYLRCDGVDDAMQTVGNVDLSWTDKVAVVAGVTKLSDAAGAVLTEFGAPYTGGGGFGVFVPITASPSWGASLSGSIGNSTAQSTGYVAPGNAILTATFDTALSVAAVRGRRNAGAWSESVNAPGAMNLASRTLYLFARAGTSLYFGGRFYGWILRGGPTPLAVVEAVERHMRQKMRMPA